jgi:hypothetical protein
MPRSFPPPLRRFGRAAAMRVKNRLQQRLQACGDIFSEPRRLTLPALLGSDRQLPSLSAATTKLETRSMGARCFGGLSAADGRVSVDPETFLRPEIVPSFGNDRIIPQRLPHPFGLTCLQSHIGRDEIFLDLPVHTSCTRVPLTN